MERIKDVNGNDTEPFRVFINTKLATMDSYIYITENEFQINENTKGKLLEEKKKEIPKKHPKHEKVKKELEKIKEKYEKENDLRKEDMGLRERAENFYYYMKEEINNIPNFPIQVEPDLLTNVEREVSTIQHEIVLGKELSVLDDRLEMITEEHEKNKDEEFERAEDRQEAKEQHKERERSEENEVGL